MNDLEVGLHIGWIKMTQLQKLQHAKAAWVCEKVNDAYRMAHLADRAIELIEKDIERLKNGKVY